LGLRAARAETVVSGLEPGQSRYLSRLTGMLMRVANLDLGRVDLDMFVSRPADPELKDGYDPLPDLAWLSLLKPKHRLGPGAEAASDVAITLPADPRLKRGRFQAQLVSTARDGRGGIVSVKARLLLHVGKQRRPGRLQELPDAAGAFQLFGGGQRVKGVPLGRRIALRQYGAVLKVANLSDKNLRLRAWVAEPDETDYGEGYAAVPNPEFMAWAPDAMEVPAGGVRELDFTLKIPDQARYAGRRWVFPVIVADEQGGYRRCLWYVATPERRPRRE
jgi:hypothetical protein